MRCEWCGRDFPKKTGRFCGTCYPPWHPSRHSECAELQETLHEALHNANLRKLIDATAMGIQYHPALRGKLDEQTGKDIYTMLTTLATHVFCMSNKEITGNRISCQTEG